MPSQVIGNQRIATNRLAGNEEHHHSKYQHAAFNLNARFVAAPPLPAGLSHKSLAKTANECRLRPPQTTSSFQQSPRRV
jgi:hypothetical protein